mgnify:FL=1
MEGLRWILEQRERYNIRVVNISFGTVPDHDVQEEKQLNRQVEQLWDAGIVVAQIAFARPCDPDLGGIAAGRTLRDMHMDRFQRLIFVGPEIDPIRADLKNLRHSLRLPLWRTAK